VNNQWHRRPAHLPATSTLYGVVLTFCRIACAAFRHTFVPFAWAATRHYLVTVLTFLKKIFYAKTFDEAAANLAAKELAADDPADYRRRVEDCVRASQKNVFVNEEGSMARFTEEELSHRVLRDLLKANVKDPTTVSKQAILSMIDKASKV
jgi:hypothetical protein